ncbi:MAG TPA: sporulation integral membrane protein YtvI [Bacillota bacterium]|nr:sporulation integral membrane protein YtvI [Bacillota bacterium]
MEGSTYNSGTVLYKRLIIRFVITIVLVLSIIFLLPIIFHMLGPFIFALLVAALVNSLVRKINKGLMRINKKFIVSNKVTTFILNVIVLIGVFLLLFLLVSTIVKEAIALTNNIQRNWNDIVDKIENVFDNFVWFDRIPERVIEMVEGWEGEIFDHIQNLGKNLVGTTISTTKYVISATSSIFVNILTFILALFFIAADYDYIKGWAKKRIGKRVLKPFRLLKDSIKNAFGRYLRAQLILALFAFLFMLIALTVYRQPYALILALLLGFIDLLPLVGTIAVLAPWGIVELIGGDFNKGVFLLILGVGFFLIRRAIEPKVMGSQTGLHPLVALLSIYVGLQFSGLWGAILGPIVVVLFISITKAGVFTNTVSDLKEACNRVADLLSKNKGDDQGEKAT